ncbi:hypothetical protein CRM22_010379 [Opisthorchis felineus]|uniref:Tyrosinase copper-binding domain-containing protein n=1 Tax=Opisthorchis felineus TaxID=147828 RepID=A0A4S2KZB5_OPIFE|nr:hypothetical protein CRM22_010379 [Opisthorchis felineus]
MQYVNHIISLWLFITISAWEADALIPKVCIHNITAIGGSGVCCPIPKGAIHPCGGVGIGTCQRQYIQFEQIPKHNLRDDRLHWPSRFFKYTCQCEGNYFGVGCEECYYGWKGPLCNKREKVLRRNVMSFTKKEKRMFVDIVAHMPLTYTDYVIIHEGDRYHSDPLWKPKFMDVHLQYLIAYLHEYASRGTLYKDDFSCRFHKKLDNNHHVLGFATWHRYFMLVWERQLRKIATRLYGWKDFAVPYWDWIDADKCDVCVNSLVGAPGPFIDGVRLIHRDSPFSNWTEQCSPPRFGGDCISCHTAWPNFKPLNRHYKRTAFPTTRDLQFTLSRGSFYLPQKEEDDKKCRGFHQALEGFCSAPGTNEENLFMHNKVHNMVHGSFCCASTAANDPLFLLHHSQIDRITQVWFEHYRPRPTEYPNHGVDLGSCRECNIIGFIPTIRHVQMFVDLRQLGIYYDNYHFGKHGYRGEEFIKHGPSYYMDL